MGGRGGILREMVVRFAGEQLPLDNVTARYVHAPQRPQHVPQPLDHDAERHVVAVEMAAERQAVLPRPIAQPPEIGVAESPRPEVVQVHPHLFLRRRQRGRVGRAEGIELVHDRVAEPVVKDIGGAGGPGEIAPGMNAQESRLVGEHQLDGFPKVRAHGLGVALMGNGDEGIGRLGVEVVDAGPGSGDPISLAVQGQPVADGLGICSPPLGRPPGPRESRARRRTSSSFPSGPPGRRRILPARRTSAKDSRVFWGSTLLSAPNSPFGMTHMLRASWATMSSSCRRNWAAFQRPP